MSGSDTESHECARRPGLVAEKQFSDAAAQTKFAEKSLNAARLVLVDGKSLVEAAQLVGFKHKQHVWRCVRAIRKRLKEGGHCTVCGHELKSQEPPPEQGGGVA